MEVLDAELEQMKNRFTVCLNPRGCLSWISYQAFAADDATRRHAPIEVTITVRPTRAAKGRVNSRNSTNPSVAVPTRRRVCDCSRRYSFWVVVVLPTMCTTGGGTWQPGGG